MRRGIRNRPAKPYSQGVKIENKPFSSGYFPQVKKPCS
nr:MAG TPA: hypothetical protein [Caudoviricetes sp.]